MLYHWYELGHAAVRPARAAAGSLNLFFNHPLNPLSHTMLGRHAAAVTEVFERTTRRYAKPEFGLTTACVDGTDVSVTEEVVWQAPFCRLIHFKRELPATGRAADPRILLVAPMSGHYATLLRGTVEALLPTHEVFITDWQDARDVPLMAGSFDLDDYIDYIRIMLGHLGSGVHVFAVCQPGVPVLAALSLMEEDGDPAMPRSLILAGSPIDTRINPTLVNDVAERRGANWFRNNVITLVPWPNAGAGRAVYPGFLQLTGFMSMNIDRHANAHKDLFLDLVRGDGDSAEKHRTFYDEYLAVMDLSAEFYLDTIEKVFIRHDLPLGTLTHRGRPVKTEAVRRTPILAIEGEKDDITGLGQCRAALDLCSSLDVSRKHHFECAGVGHYGIFNGSRFRAEIVPRISEFVRAYEKPAEPAAVEPERAASDARAREAATPALSEAESLPFRMFARAGKLVIEGMFNVRLPDDR